jgi:hypothetical protein
MRAQSFPCAIAGKPVEIVLRSGAGLLESGRPYMRCSERECQYVDLNQPPCPLRPEMDDDGATAQVFEHLDARRPHRVCYTCLADEVSVTHAQVRRAMWHLREGARVTIEPGRCSSCKRRRVSVCVRAPRLRAGQDASSPPPVNENVARDRWNMNRRQPAIVVDDTSVRESERAVVTALQQAGGALHCPACLAFMAELSLADVRRIMRDLVAHGRFVEHDGPCSGCGRWQSMIREKELCVRGSADAP